MKNILRIIPVLFLCLCFSECNEIETVDETLADKKAEEIKQKDNPPCTAGELPSTSLEQFYNCADTRYSTNVNLNNSYMIIRSQSEFNQNVTSTCIFNIDFSKYDLIIGKRQLTSGNQSIIYEYTTTDCITKKLKVIFNQDNTTFAPNITYHRLVPKIGANEIVIVEQVVK